MDIKTPDHDLKPSEILIWVREDATKLDIEWIDTVFIEKFWAEIRTILTGGFNRDTLLNPCNSIERVLWETNESFKVRVAEWHL